MIFHIFSRSLNKRKHELVPSKISWLMLGSQPFLMLFPQSKRFGSGKPLPRRPPKNWALTPPRHLQNRKKRPVFSPKKWKVINFMNGTFWFQFIQELYGQLHYSSNCLVICSFQKELLNLTVCYCIVYCLLLSTQLSCQLNKHIDLSVPIAIF